MTYWKELEAKCLQDNGMNFYDILTKRVSILLGKLNEMLSMEDMSEKKIHKLEFDGTPTFKLYVEDKDGTQNLLTDSIGSFNDYKIMQFDRNVDYWAKPPQHGGYWRDIDEGNILISYDDLFSEYLDELLPFHIASSASDQVVIPYTFPHEKVVRDRNGHDKGRGRGRGRDNKRGRGRGNSRGRGRKY